MSYDEAFREAERRSYKTGLRFKLYKSIWDGEYIASPFHIPFPHAWAVLIGEVKRD